VLSQETNECEGSEESLEENSEEEVSDEDDDDENVLSESVLSENGLYKGSMYAGKEVDRPSAARLAKRLYHLHGFKKSDVARHLSKKNSFAQLVSEEYLNYFDFTGEALPTALRSFIKQLILSNETQDRERLLSHFAARYHQCNPTTYKSQDSCHTLACAMLLLNNDLHGPNVGRRMTLPEFINNLSDMNDGDNFARDVLKVLYQSIRAQPLEIDSGEEGDGCQCSGGSQQPSIPNQLRSVSNMSHLLLTQVPDHESAVEYKKGYVMRKCCVEPEGRKTPLGKRGWKMFYATLCDMVLFLHNDEHGLKRHGNSMATHYGNTLQIHHSLATKATDYVKKSHVFRLQTADMAQYLIQTSDSKECQEWIDAINFVAASYSAPCQPAGGAESQRHLQRHVLPSSYTKLNLREQISQHERMVVECDCELMEHRKKSPEKGARARLIQNFVRKENYIKFELKRYKTYCRLLQYKISAFPELEPSLAEIAIGEVDEPLGSSTSLSLSALDSPGSLQSTPTTPCSLEPGLGSRSVGGVVNVGGAFRWTAASSSPPPSSHSGVGGPNRSSSPTLPPSPSRPVTVRSAFDRF